MLLADSLRIALAAAAVLLSAGTGTGDVTGSTGPSATDPPAVEGDLTVFAAASLTDAFEAIGTAFEQAHPDVDVTFSFASSSDLVGQIVEGAPADVFASADVANMAKLVDAEANRDEPQTFATNSLAIIVEAGNPQNIGGVEDLAADRDLIVVSCAPEVPIGAYTQQVFANAGVEVDVDSFEENVRAVSAKVQLGEADAGLVYTTDVVAAGDAATGVTIPDDINIVAEYPIATTAESGNPDAADAFVEFLLGDGGQRVLAEFGFGSPMAATSSSTPPAASPSDPATTAA